MEVIIWEWSMHGKRPVLWNFVQLYVFMCKIHFSLWVIVWIVGKACGSALTFPSSASSQSFYRALFIEPFWRSLWPCAFLWGSTFKTQHSFLPEASWSMARTLVPVCPVPATCTSPSPHPPPITHTHTHTHTHTGLWLEAPVLSEHWMPWPFM